MTHSARLASPARAFSCAAALAPQPPQIVCSRTWRFGMGGRWWGGWMTAFGVALLGGEHQFVPSPLSSHSSARLPNRLWRDRIAAEAVGVENPADGARPLRSLQPRRDGGEGAGPALRYSDRDLRLLKAAADDP